MKRRLKRLLLACPGFEPLCRLLTRTHVRALMYHRFSADASSDGRRLDAPRLREQAAYLSRHHELWRPHDHLELLQARRRPGHCPVVVTADDGYADFFAFAFPIFRDYGIPATLFVTTGFVDGRIWFWWDRLEWLLAHAPASRGESDFGGRNVVWDLTDDVGRVAAWHHIADRCRFLPDAEKEAALSAFGATLGLILPIPAPSEYAPVTWEQVREMVGQGILMGAHSVTHPILSRVSPAEAAAEITNSRRRLAEAAGIDTGWFSYPQGGPADFTPEVQATARDAGFSGCYVAWQIMRKPVDPYALPRYCATTDMVEFRWTMCGAEWLQLRMRCRFGLRTGAGPDYWAGSK